MNQRVAFPFLTLPDRVVHSGEWLIGDVGKPLFPCGSILEFWDYDRDLEVKFELSVDLEGAAKALGLAIDDMKMTALLKVGTGRGTTPRSILHCVTVPVDLEGQANLRTEMDSSKLSSRLWLEASLVLGAAPSAPSPLSPRQPGSRLWSTSLDILLEDGGDSRLPMETLAFSQVFSGKRHEDALWFVDWRPYAWEADFAGNVRLYLNKDREHFLQSVLAGDPFYLQMIMSDLMTQIVSAYVLAEISDSPTEHDEVSIARQAHEWMSLAFPGHSVHAVRTLLQDKPGEFNAAIHAAAEVGEEP